MAICNQRIDYSREQVIAHYLRRNSLIDYIYGVLRTLVIVVQNVYCVSSYLVITWIALFLVSWFKSDLYSRAENYLYNSLLYVVSSWSLAAESTVVEVGDDYKHLIEQSQDILDKLETKKQQQQQQLHNQSVNYQSHLTSNKNNNTNNKHPADSNHMNGLMVANAHNAITHKSVHRNDISLKQYKETNSTHTNQNGTTEIMSPTCNFTNGHNTHACVPNNANNDIDVNYNNNNNNNHTHDVDDREQILTKTNSIDTQNERTATALKQLSGDDVVVASDSDLIISASDSRTNNGHSDCDLIIGRQNGLKDRKQQNSVQDNDNFSTTNGNIVGPTQCVGSHHAECVCNGISKMNTTNTTAQPICNASTMSSIQSKLSPTIRKDQTRQPRILLLCNHVSTADVPLLMQSLTTLTNQSLLWVMDAQFKFTNFGLICSSHGDFYITKKFIDGSLRDHVLKQPERNLLMLFPEGGFLRKRIEGSNRYANRNGLPTTKYVTHPRFGAFKDLIDPSVGVTHIVDATLLYENIKNPLSILDIVLGIRKEPAILHYKVYDCKDINPTEEWLRDIWLAKDKLMQQYYEDRDSFYKRFEVGMRSIKLDWIKLFAVHLFYLLVCYLTIYRLFSATSATMLKARELYYSDI